MTGPRRLAAAAATAALLLSSALVVPATEGSVPQASAPAVQPPSAGGIASAQTASVPSLCFGNLLNLGGCVVL